MHPHDRERGGSTVEMAFVLPIILAAIGLVLTVAWAFACKGLVNRGAEYGARAAAVPVDLATRTYASTAQVQTAAREGTIVLPFGDDLLDTQLACEPAACREGAQVQVTVSYVWTNPAASLLNVLAGEPAQGAYTFSAEVRRVRE